jgi:hydrogenase expression/formation protein HypE
MTPLDLTTGRVDLTHGGGGRAMAQLIDDLFVRAFDNPALARRNDQGRLDMARGTGTGRLVMTTDGYVISPLFFAGGDIGSLAVHGTLNDIAMGGARPIALSASYILEEGLPLADLARIVGSMAAAARQAGVPIVTGDTKVVEKGKADGVFISTTGIGEVFPGVEVSGDLARPGDAVILSGTLGDHGVAVMSQREGLGFETQVQSDSAALHTLVEAVVGVAAEALHVLRDPTRGGLAATLNEIAQASKVGIGLEEEAIPVREAVRGACELLGLDPLHVANEGKMVVICDGAAADGVLAALRAHPLGAAAALIGRVIEDDHCFVRMETAFGGTRMVDWLAGEQLPRIC